MRRFLEELKEFPQKGDMVLLILCLITSGFGMVIIASATNAEKFGNNIRYIAFQLVAIGLGVLIYALISSIDMEFLQEHRNLMVAFNVMLLLMLILGIIAVVISRKKKPLCEYNNKLLGLFGISLFLPVIANASGWIMAEMGRYPWVVYGLQKIEDGVSTVTSPGTVLISLIGFIVIFAVLAIVEIFLMVRHGIKNPVTDKEIVENEKEASLWT